MAPLVFIIQLIFEVLTKLGFWNLIKHSFTFIFFVREGKEEFNRVGRYVMECVVMCTYLLSATNVHYGYIDFDLKSE